MLPSCSYQPQSFIFRLRTRDVLEDTVLEEHLDLLEAILSAPSRQPERPVHPETQPSPPRPPRRGAPARGEGAAESDAAFARDKAAMLARAEADVQVWVESNYSDLVGCP